MRSAVKVRQNHPFDQGIIDNAAFYTAIVFIARGDYRRETPGLTYPSLDAARDGGRRLARAFNKPAMIYAVDGRGYTAHVENVF